MDLGTGFQIHTNVRCRPPKTIQMLKKLLIFVNPIKSCYIATISIKRIFINFQVYHRNEKNQFESSYGFGDAISKLETFVWIWNHVSRPITWLLFN